ncbi:BMP family lipoprotein [Weissella cibaria]|uniref:BMP family ABC transporter substrate-binding protein n=1 Tax=Weissella cibaria TaxID=137591 RepID=A0A9Q8JJD8_9LACO|nr:BMP family protein [Weissella cibaria]QDG81075.1 BMP family ABC transporter substrate-binding protein [Weissella cibaria]QMU88761.1 BMP family protein [Weissella cibaria]TVV28473.1 BMP family ABC transporter substrate-binding protein [Weissella cibaria]TVV37075.1 BMP family ABC transporter substrate-binding protein [Weissella cibaria]TVV41666.1 BMP family ABC transporter substrate-binding protein [Weissella cibaria]
MVSRRTLIIGGVAVVVVAGIAYAATSGSKGGSSDKFTAAVVSDTNGVNDKGFNQSAWEGLEKWGKANNLSKGQNGYNYFQPKTVADYDTQLTQAATAKYNVVSAIGNTFKDSVQNVSKKYPDTKFVLVDEIADKKYKNVASVMFHSEQSSYLVGIAAATKAKEIGDDTVGFVGGMKNQVIESFLAGYQAGVKSVDPNMKVDATYAGTFSDPAKGQTIAKAKMAQGEHIIFQAAGGVGNGVFQAAKDQDATLAADSKDKVWVIGVDMDQTNMGDYRSKDGKSANLTLTSSLTGVGRGVQLITESAQKDKFPGGKTVYYGLKEGGVGVVTKNLNADEKKAVETAKEKIISGDIKVPTTPEN